MNYYVVPQSYPSGIKRGRNSATTTATKELIAAPGTALALMITQVVIYNTHATDGTGVNLMSGSEVIYGPIPAPPGNGGAVVTFPIPLPCNENEAFQFATEDAITTVKVSALGYIANAGQS